MKIEVLEALVEAAKNLGADEVMFQEPGRDGDPSHLKDCSATIERHGPQMDTHTYLVIKER